MSKIDVLINDLQKEIGLNVTQKLDDQCRTVYVWKFREVSSAGEFKTKNDCLADFMKECIKVIDYAAVNW